MGGSPNTGNTSGGGGGGGGLYGGGGGLGDANNNHGGGGGGGSSFGPAGSQFDNGVRSGHGIVIISWVA